MKVEDLNMSHWMFSCKDISVKVSESMDRTLPFHHRIMIRIHLLMCKYCSRLKDQLIILRLAARIEDLPTDETDRSPGLTEDASERIKKALRNLDPTPNNPDST